MLKGNKDTNTKLTTEQYNVVFNAQPVVNRYREILEDDEIISMIKDVAIELTLKKTEDLTPNQLAFKNELMTVIKENRTGLDDSKLMEVMQGFAIGIAMTLRKPLAGKPVKGENVKNGA